MTKKFRLYVWDQVRRSRLAHNRSLKSRTLPLHQTQAHKNNYLIIHIPNTSPYAWEEPRHVYQYLLSNPSARYHLVEDAARKRKFTHQAVYAIHPSLPLPIPLFTFTTDDDLLKDLNLIREFVCAHLNPTIIPPVSVHFVHRKLAAEDFPSLIEFLLPETM